eukprot:tig00000093_g3446.t1
MSSRSGGLSSASASTASSPASAQRRRSSAVHGSTPTRSTTRNLSFSDYARADAADEVEERSSGRHRLAVALTSKQEELANARSELRRKLELRDQRQAERDALQDAAERVKLGSPESRIAREFFRGNLGALALVAVISLALLAASCRRGEGPGAASALGSRGLRDALGCCLRVVHEERLFVCLALLPLAGLAAAAARCLRFPASATLLSASLHVYSFALGFAIYGYRARSAPHAPPAD